MCDELCSYNRLLLYKTMGRNSVTRKIVLITDYYCIGTLNEYLVEVRFYYLTVGHRKRTTHRFILQASPVLDVGTKN